MYRAKLILAVGLLVVFLRPAAAENWPQWRGPARDGVSHETGLATNWSPTHNVAWRVPLPGPGGATPVVWGERIFVTSADGDELVLLAISTDGKTLWRQVLGVGERFYRVDEGNNASPSPSTDGKFVWACTSTGNLACYTVEGQPVWKVDLQERYGQYDIQYGMSSTPLLDGDRLYLQLLHGPINREPAKNQLVVALDKNTGAEVWRHVRPSDAVMENKQSYASPALYRDDQRAFLITHGSDYAIGHNLEDGSEIWRCGGINPKGVRYNPTLRLVASPVAAEGRIVIPSAKRGPVLCLKPDVKGDITEDPSAFFWRVERITPDVSSPLVHDGLVYLAGESGDYTCLDADNGQVVWQQRAAQRRRHRASPVYADGKIYMTARDGGVVTVLRAGRKYEVLAENELGEPITASPAISHGRIYLRSFKALYAIAPDKDA